MPTQIQQHAKHLFETWQDNNGRITAYKMIDMEIDNLKLNILNVVTS